MNAVGIDVSKGKSMVAIMRPLGETVSAPFEIKHTASDINSLVELKKRAQGKPYYVYMTAGTNKFLRIYYGRVKEYLSSLPES